MCNGQIMAINQNTALFSLLGTTYGGNGQTTFALPDLRGRVPLHFGQGPGLSPYCRGRDGGVESVTLHRRGDARAHAFAARDRRRRDDEPPEQRASRRAGVSMRTASDGSLTWRPRRSAGGSQPHENRQPYLASTTSSPWRASSPPGTDARAATGRRTRTTRSCSSCSRPPCEPGLADPARRPPTARPAP